MGLFDSPEQTEDVLKKVTFKKMAQHCEKLTDIQKNWWIFDIFYKNLYYIFFSKNFIKNFWMLNKLLQVNLFFIILILVLIFSVLFCEALKKVSLLFVIFYHQVVYVVSDSVLFWQIVELVDSILIRWTDFGGRGALSEDKLWPWHFKPPSFQMDI